MNIYVPNIKAHTYVKETLLELNAHIKLHTPIVGGQPDRNLTEK